MVSSFLVIYQIRDEGVKSLVLKRKTVPGAAGGRVGEALQKEKESLEEGRWNLF